MDKLDSTQLEQLQAIGTYLSEIRREQSRTLEEIAAKTYIPLRLLRALEAGQPQILPEPVFIQGFIRRYADTLGLDGWDIAQQFPVQTTASGQPAIKSDYIDESLAQLAPGPVVVDSPLPKGFSMRSSRPSYTPYWLAGLGLAGVGGLFYLLGRPQPPAAVADRPDAPPAESSPSTVPATPSPAAATPAPVSPSVSPTPAAARPQPSAPAASPSATPRPANAPVTVNVSLTEASWMQVIVDGQVALEETLPRGTKRSWNAERAVTIVAGNAGAVEVAFNQAKAERMGALGAVEERTFTATTAGTPTPSP